LKNKKVLCGLGDLCGEFFWWRLGRAVPFVAAFAVLRRGIFDAGYKVSLLISRGLECAQRELAVFQFVVDDDVAVEIDVRGESGPEGLHKMIKLLVGFRQ
jgi:hypothetical protein